MYRLLYEINHVLMEIPVAEKDIRSTALRLASQGAVNMNVVGPNLELKSPFDFEESHEPKT